MKQTVAAPYVETRVYMDTVVVIELVQGDSREDPVEQAARAYGWFSEVERRCSRFDDGSELSALSRHRGAPTTVSTLLFNVLDVALEIARLTDGALDPAVGRAMEDRGFNTNYLTGERVTSVAESGGSYRDIVLDRETQTVTLLRPITLDLGAVAKGFAIDLAGRELRDCRGCLINAGGDIFVRGADPDGELWPVGIRHPRRPDELIAMVRLTDVAVCTSGDYERRPAGGEGHHILHPATGAPVSSTVSATVVAPTAVVADALSTAVFVLGAEAGLQLLEDQGLDGMIIDADLRVRATEAWGRYVQ